MLCLFVFVGCEEESSFEFEEGVITGYEGEIPKNLVIPEEIGGVTVEEIGDEAFIKNRELVQGEMLSYQVMGERVETVKIPDTVTKIGEFAFAGSDLEELEIGENVEEVSRAAFYKNKNLKEVVVEADVIGDWAFKQSGLVSLELGENVSKIGVACFRNNDLGKAELPNSITSLGTSAFENNHIETLVLPKDLTEIPSRVFMSNIIETVDIPEQVTIINCSAFSNNKLEEVNFSEGLKVIGGSIATSKGDGGAFENNALESLSLPETLKSVEAQAFFGNELEVIEIGSEVELDTTSFLGNPGDFGKFYEGKAGVYEYEEEKDVWRLLGYEEEIEDELVAYLTFDDGPSDNTKEILDVLDEYDVPATFFVTGNNTTGDPNIYNRIIAEGHVLGNHTYTHNFHQIYQSPEDFMEDFIRLETFIKEQTGEKMDIMRFPGGSSSALAREVSGYNIIVDDLINKVKERGYDYFDWNVSSGDGNGDLTKEEIKGNAMAGAKQEEDVVVLFHDSKTRHTTVEALPKIIEGYLERGYNFETLSHGKIDVKHR